MSKFKVGDRVRISPGKDSPNSDRLGTITNGQGDGNGWHSVACDDDGRIWSVNKSRLTLLTDDPTIPDPDKAILDAFDASDPQADIANECDAIKAMLLEKNRAYGNSALEPVRVFSRADPVEQLRVRLDDKISRLMRGENAGEDVELDLIGYLVLLRIAKRQKGGKPT